MNYYEHHLGDYMRDTAHLSMLEDGAYRRLIDAYYIREAPLPLPLRDVLRLARATSKQDREAVEVVLREFFTETPEGWRHGRCDREVGRFRLKSEKAKASINARWEKARSEQQANDERNTNVFPAGYERTTDDIHRAPVPSPQTPVTRPIPKDQERGPAVPPLPRAPIEDPPEAGGQPPTAAGAVCRAMRKAGLQAVNPGDPRLLALLAQGATEAEFVGIATEAAAGHKGFPWVLHVLAARRQEAAAITLAPAPAAAPWHASWSEVVNRGCALGIGPWDEVAASTGSGPGREAYRREVIAADAAQRQGATA